MANVIISGEDLTIGDIRRVALEAIVKLFANAGIHRKLAASRGVIRAGIARGEHIYGVTALFGVRQTPPGPEALAGA